MTKAELIAIIVPATIELWKVATPQYKHDGKEKELKRNFQSWSKKDLETKLYYLIERGYAS